MEKQSDVIVKMQEKLDEFSKNCDLTSTNLEKTKLENRKLKEEGCIWRCGHEKEDSGPGDLRDRGDHRKHGEP